MRVLMITQIYPPEMGALAHRMYPIARRLVAGGHQVFVATGMPNYPEGVVFPGYQGARTMREEIDGVTVLRTAYHMVPRNQSKSSQLRSYLSFVRAAFRSGMRAGPVDVVFVTSPPIFPVMAGIWLARLRKAKLVLDLRDLWPDEIIACQAATEGSAAVRLVRSIERRGYRAADAVCCTTEAFIRTVMERGVPESKTLLLPNGADLAHFRPLPARNPVADQHPFGDRFVAMYMGLLGIKHGLDSVLAAAHLLREEERILFALVGTGPRRAALVEQARQMELRNVLLIPEHPLEELPYLLARADVCLSTLLPAPYLEKIISAKMFEYLACGKPVLAAQAGEGARLVERASAGVVVPPGDADAMAQAVLTLSRDPDLCEQMGRRGREHVVQNYSRDETAGRLEARLRQLCGEITVREPAAVAH